MARPDRFDSSSLQPASPAPVHGMTVKKANRTYTEKIVSFLKPFKEVSFFGWQDEELVIALLNSDSAYCYIAENREGQLIGAVTGLALGTRGTISHLAVATDYQGSKIGTSLTKSLLNDFRQHGVHQIYLFIEQDSLSTLGFWRRQGFRASRNQKIYKVDL